MDKSGIAVTTCSSGEDALEVFSDVQPDMVLLDINLPGMDGIEVCQRLRKTTADAMIPILLVTAGGDKEAINRGYHAGATDFLTKPLDWASFSHRARFLVQASRSMNELRHNRTSLANAQRLAKLGSFTFDAETNESRWSSELYSILGLIPEKHPASRNLFTDRIHPDDRDHVLRVTNEALDLNKIFTVEHRLLLPNGDVRHVRQCGEPIEDGRGHVIVTGVVQDITDHTRAIDQIRYLANFDGLTGLTNRRQFNARLMETLRHAKASKSLVAIMVLDIDRFKLVNDSLGHTAGDQILQILADRINKQVRSSDCVGRVEADGLLPEVARVGGDEFTLLLPRVAHPTDAGRVAQRVLEAIPEPIDVEGQRISLNGSIGISIFPLDGEAPEALLRQADRAMSFAKSQGGDSFQYYTESLNETSLRRLVLETKLREAVENERLHVLYQPKCNIHTNEVIGMEALLRWVEPDLGDISPNEFIPLAEEIGLISKIGRWVLREACMQNKQWQDDGFAPISVSVNVSSRQFSDTDVFTIVTEVLEETQLDPQWLELEITESAMLEDETATIEALDKLRKLGSQVSLDDFGTGFSSLSYLRRLPLDTLKVDRSFVMDLPHDKDAKGIVAAIIAMAHVLDLTVIAEGVETEEQRSFLRSIECDEMQGYLFSKPIKPDEFEQFLVRNSD
ncbi:MAG: diguanylate cyclase (GGDEF)-like protein/PAS domain S-box-containing protein [Myxococcota bacterium]|jgi:diguanylate cyclase (GGDEF)-like protein/PAS domain S-box-containing protein